jgi:teichuronic acid biosynthesis glycosyltransferase TuaC
VIDAGSAIRVLMITSEWPVPDGRPRTTFFIKRQAEFLQAAGVDVDVFHFKGAGRPWNYVKAWARVRERIARGNYDLVHAQFGQSGLLALPKRLPLVVTFRGDDLQGIEDANGRLTLGGRALKLASQAVARCADASIVVSEHMKELIHPSVRTHVIPSGLDLTLFRPIPRDEARRHLGVSLAKRLVLFAGDPALPRKRYGLARAAIDVLNRSLEAELIIAWGAPHTNVPFFMNACDALVFTSMQEGSPNVVKEALACNLPVVSVAVGDVPMRLRDIAGCELCADDQPATIAAALERVLRRGQRIAGRDAVRELDERKLTEEVIAIYRSVLARRDPRPQVVEASDAVS